MKYCIYCGAEIHKGTKFCIKCGRPIDNLDDNETSDVENEIITGEDNDADETKGVKNEEVKGEPVYEKVGSGITAPLNDSDNQLSSDNLINDENAGQDNQFEFNTYTAKLASEDSEHIIYAGYNEEVTDEQGDSKRSFGENKEHETVDASNSFNEELIGEDLAEEQTVQDGVYEDSNDASEDREPEERPVATVNKLSPFNSFLSSRGGKASVLAGILLIVLVFCFATHIICFHEWTEATCTEPETCVKCGDTRGEPKGHSFTEATCTEAAKCTVCGYVEGSPLGHKVEKWITDSKATCTEAGSRHGTCAVCGEKITEKLNALGHDWSKWKTTKKASTREEGKKERICSRCDKKETETIPVMSQEALDKQLEEKFPVSSAYTIFELYGKQECPFGFKPHAITGRIAEYAYDEDTWFIKYNVAITNAFGAEYETVAEARISGTYENPDVEYFYIYDAFL